MKIRRFLIRSLYGAFVSKQLIVRTAFKYFPTNSSAFKMITNAGLSHIPLKCANAIWKGMCVCVGGWGGSGGWGWGFLVASVWEYPYLHCSYDIWFISICVDHFAWPNLWESAQSHSVNLKLHTDLWNCLNKIKYFVPGLLCVTW